MVLGVMEERFEAPIPDQCECQEIPLANGPAVRTDPHTVATDGDGLGDGRASTSSQPIRTVEDRFVSFAWTADPTVEDTDADSLDDDTEVEGWEIETINRSGAAYRWAGSVEGAANGSLEVTSDPLRRDTDGDGLTDRQEHSVMHTDPRDPVTYRITAAQAEFLRNLKDARSVGFLARTLSLPRQTVGREIAVGRAGLNDATSDFDFVVEDSYETLADAANPMDAMAFTALDGATRTDIWYPNRDELLWTAPPGWDQPEVVDPWDPDSDDDGLTDGQEARGKNIGLAFTDLGSGSRYPWIRFEQVLNPADPDTDGDGYWDGWIGVYGIGYSENVILYREHLHDSDPTVPAPSGIRGAETVPEQALLHEVDDDDPGAYLFENDTKYHSTVHVGELRWHTSPRNESSEPDTAWTLEVDFYAGIHHETVDTVTWERSVEQNMRLFGLEVDVIRDETVTDQMISDASRLTDLSDGISYPLTGQIGGELETIYTHFGQDSPDTNEWLLVGPKHSSRYGFLGKNHPGATLIVHAPAHQPVISNISAPVQNSPYQSELAMLTADTVMHEMGHTYCVGLADDEGVDTDECTMENEIYSGDTGMHSDPTPERIWGEMERSLMSNNYEQQFAPPLSGRYFIFSIQELLTIHEPE